MFSRRLLRVKIVQVLYAYFKRTDAKIENAEKELMHSIEKTYELYFFLIMLYLDVIDELGKQIEKGRVKLVPSYNDLHPNTKFIDNQVGWILNRNEQYNKYINQHRISWINYQPLVRELCILVSEMPEYQKYISKVTGSFEEDKQLTLKIFEDVFANSESLMQSIEEQSIYWNDDVEYVLSMILKTISTFKENAGSRNQLMPMFKNEDDRDYVIKLFRKTILKNQEIRKIIQDHTDNWEIDRIAFMDVVIIQIAICELLEFPTIPVKVTLNEFIEISKYYSTEKSSTFINGILDKVLTTFRKDNLINKQGRGMVGEPEMESSE